MGRGFTRANGGKCGNEAKGSFYTWLRAGQLGGRNMGSKCHPSRKSNPTPCGADTWNHIRKFRRVSGSCVQKLTSHQRTEPIHTLQNRSIVGNHRVNFGTRLAQTLGMRRGDRPRRVVFHSTSKEELKERTSLDHAVKTFQGFAQNKGQAPQPHVPGAYQRQHVCLGSRVLVLDCTEEAKS